MEYIKNNRRHYLRALHVCEIIELEKGTQLELLNGKKITFTQNYETVRNVIDGKDEETLLTVEEKNMFVK